MTMQYSHYNKSIGMSTASSVHDIIAAKRSIKDKFSFHLLSAAVRLSLPSPAAASIVQIFLVAPPVAIGVNDAHDCTAPNRCSCWRYMDWNSWENSTAVCRVPTSNVFFGGTPFLVGTGRGSAGMEEGAKFEERTGEPHCRPSVFIGSVGFSPRVEVSRYYHMFITELLGRFCKTEP